MQDQRDLRTRLKVHLLTANDCAKKSGNLKRSLRNIPSPRLN
jgi:hypothetical protein